MLKNLWLLWNNVDSLWVDWIRNYVLHEQDVLEIQVKQTDSWAWRKILKLRELLPIIGGFDLRFKTREAWDKLRDKKDPVSWYKVVWGKLSIPRYSFIAWLVVLNRLATKDRMVGWGMVINTDCILCGNGIENREHMFLSCDFSRNVWREVLAACNLTANIQTWEDFLLWIERRGKGRTLIATILRLAWCAYAYFIWHERNSRLHGGGSRMHIVIFNLIKAAVRDRLLSAKFPYTPCHTSHAWGLD